MPTIGRDQINAGEVVDPAFADAEAAADAGDATASPPVDEELANTGVTAEAEKAAETATDSTATPPRMDDVVEDDPRTSGFTNRIDVITEHGVELPDAAREHMGVPAGMRGDNPNEEPFEAPRSWGGSGADQGADGASGADAGAAAGGAGADEGRNDSDPGRGGPRHAATNGGAHPSEEHRQDDEDGGLVRTDDGPQGGRDDADTGAGGHGRGAADEQRRDDRGDRGADEGESLE